MPTLTLISSYKIDLDQVISVEEIRANYLFGINLTKNGQAISDDLIEYYIDSSSKEIERQLNIKLTKQVYEETRDFIGDDWRTWGYLKASYPVVVPLLLDGYLGTIKQVHYPTDWLSTKKTSDGTMFSRIIYLVPNTGSNFSEVVVFSGVLPYLSTYGQQPQIPNYWTMKYVTGFDTVPLDIKNAIGKLASINILLVASDFLQSNPGQSSQSISIDGLSQSSSTFGNSNAGIFGARVKQYGDELKSEIANLRNYYSDILMITA